MSLDAIKHSLLVVLGVSYVLCICSCVSLRDTRADIKAADAYIKALEAELDRLSPSMVDDAMSGTDEYCNYYQNK